MSFKFGQRSLSRLSGVHPDLQKLMLLSIEGSPYDFGISAGARTAQEQAELYALGRTKPGKIVTNCDGYKKKSNHQPKSDGYGYAVDIFIYSGGKADFSVEKLSKVAAHIKKIAASLNINISWGGDWRSFKDYPHFELAK